MAFDDETIDVLIGGYLSRDAAMEDYESVLGCGGYLHGAVVVSKDLEGNLAVEQTDHLVRKGAAGLGAIGFAVGLFAPPLLAATAVGAAIGAGAGKLLHNRTAAKLEEQAGATIPLGGAGLIVAYPHSAAGQVEPAVTRAVSRVVGEAEGQPRPGAQGRHRRRPGQDGASPRADVLPVASPIDGTDRRLRLSREVVEGVRPRLATTLDERTYVPVTGRTSSGIGSGYRLGPEGQSLLPASDLPPRHKPATAPSGASLSRRRRHHQRPQLCSHLIRTLRRRDDRSVNPRPPPLA